MGAILWRDCISFLRILGFATYNAGGLVINLINVVKALSFGLGGAVAFEALILLWDRLKLSEKFRRVEYDGNARIVERGLLRENGNVSSEMVEASVDFLTASGLFLSDKVVESDQKRYRDAKDAWLALSIATKREAARQTILRGRDVDMNFGLRELVELGQSEDLTRIDRMLVAGRFKGANRNLAKTVASRIRERTSNPGKFASVK
jgi:hypothetical protein